MSANLVWMLSDFISFMVVTIAFLAIAVLERCILNLLALRPKNAAGLFGTTLLVP